MARFLANENAPREAVLAARAAGFDVAWMVELQPGANDETVLSLAQQDNRVLITFDKDFGELVFHRGVSGSHGVILLRPRLPEKDHSASSRCDKPLPDDLRRPRPKLRSA
jgi:hypothetical protein